MERHLGDVLLLADFHDALLAAIGFPQDADLVLGRIAFPFHVLVPFRFLNPDYLSFRLSLARSGHSQRRKKEAEQLLEVHCGSVKQGVDGIAVGTFEPV